MKFLVIFLIPAVITCSVFEGNKATVGITKKLRAEHKMVVDKTKTAKKQIKLCERR